MHSDILPPMDIIYGTASGLSSSIPTPEPSSDAEDSIDYFGRPLYESHGRWTCMKSVPLDRLIKVVPIDDTANPRMYFEWIEIEGRRLPIISKYWDVSSRWHELYSELFAYTSAEYLRAFQGTHIPRVLGIYAIADGCIKVAMEAPQQSITGWTEASPTRTPHFIKQKIVRAYEDIHAAGVLHGDVSLRHMLVGDDQQVNLINFAHSRCISAAAPGAFTMSRCLPAELSWEMRRVKYLLDFDDARATERRVWVDTDRACFEEYEALRSARESESESRADLLPDEGHIPDVGRRRIDPRTDQWFEDLDADIGGRRFDVPPLSPGDFDNPRPISPGAPLTLPILLPPTQSSFTLTSPVSQVAPTEYSPPPTNSDGQQPSPPPTPPSRRLRISRAQRELSKVDHQISRLAARRKELVREIRALEKINYPPMFDNPINESRLVTPPRPVAGVPGPGSHDAYLPSSSRVLEETASPAVQPPLPLVGRKRKASERDDSELPATTSPVSTIHDGSPKSKRPRKALTVDVRAAQSYAGSGSDVAIEESADPAS